MNASRELLNGWKRKDANELPAVRSEEFNSAGPKLTLWIAASQNYSFPILGCNHLLRDFNVAMCLSFWAKIENALNDYDFNVSNCGARFSKKWYVICVIRLGKIVCMNVHSEWNQKWNAMTFRDDRSIFELRFGGKWVKFGRSTLKSSRFRCDIANISIHRT